MLKETENIQSRRRITNSTKIIAFDLDGTLTKSKSDIDQEMADLLCQLLKHKRVAVMGGGNYGQFQKQFLDHLECSGNQFENLLVFPTSGASLYRLHPKGEREKVYQNKLEVAEKSKILSAFEKAFRDIGYREPEKKYGEVIEDRESQITFSALGQRAPLAQKKEWNKTKDMRPQLKLALEKYLPEFEIRLGGLTSIDITKKGIDKAYGLEQLLKIFDLSKDDVVYIGDALYKDGNDSAVLRTGIEAIEVGGPGDTKEIVKNILEVDD